MKSKLRKMRLQSTIKPGLEHQDVERRTQARRSDDGSSPIWATLLSSAMETNQELGRISMKINGMETVQENMMACIQEIASTLQVQQTLIDASTNGLSISSSEIKGLQGATAQSRLLILLLTLGVILIGFDTIKIYFPSFLPNLLSIIGIYS